MNSATFANLFELFRETPEWRVMESTVENSPYHREANVAEHTRMTIQHWNDYHAHKYTQWENDIARITLLFHDLGKPDTRKDGTEHPSFHGHESVSANHLITVMGNPIIRDAFFEMGLNESDLTVIRNLIQYHLPYGIQGDKLIGLKTHMWHMGIQNLFVDILRSDQGGRISDDHASKVAKQEAWIAEVWEPAPILPTISHQPDQPVMTLLSGVSGVGKSTSLNGGNTMGRVLSLDVMREVFYAARTGEVNFNYVELHQYTEDHKQDFNLYVVKRYREVLAEGKHVTIDNMNLTRKFRHEILSLAKEYGYYVVSLQFIAPLPLLIERQVKGTSPERIAELHSSLESVWRGMEAAMTQTKYIWR